MTSQAAGVLREHGYRATPQRLLVLAAVGSLRHATPEQLLTEVHRSAPAVNLSTIYRVLEVLEAVGLVNHAHIGTGAPTYHVADTPAHVHFRCTTCGRIESLPAEVAQPFEQAVFEQLGFTCDVSHTGIYGYCAECGPDSVISSPTQEPSHDV